MLPNWSTPAYTCGMEETTSVAAVLRRLRAERGKSVREVARDVGVTPSYLSRVERGEKSLSPQVRGRLSDYYADESIDLAAGTVPSDVLEILRSRPELIEAIRKDYGSASAAT